MSDSAPPVSDDKDALLRLLGSDFLFWAALHVAREPLIRHVLATAPEQVASASDEERARVDGFGTYAAAQYTASRIPGARFVGFETGGHLLVGHAEQVQAEVLGLIDLAAQQP